MATPKKKQDSMESFQRSTRGRPSGQTAEAAEAVELTPVTDPLPPKQRRGGRTGFYLKVLERIRDEGTPESTYEVKRFPTYEGARNAAAALRKGRYGIPDLPKGSWEFWGGEDSDGTGVLYARHNG